MSTSKNNSMYWDNVTFKAVGRITDKCVFVGYAKADLVVPGALPDGTDLRLCIRDIEVKFLNDAPRIDFKSEKGSNDQWYPILFPKSKETREEFTKSLFAHPVIDAAVVTTLNITDALGCEA